MLVTPNHFMALSTSKYEIYWMWQPSKRAAMCSTTLTFIDTKFDTSNSYKIEIINYLTLFNEKLKNLLVVKKTPI